MFTHLKIFCTLMAIVMPSSTGPLPEVVIKINFVTQEGYESPQSDTVLVTSLTESATSGNSVYDVFGLNKLPEMAQNTLEVQANPRYTAGKRVPGDALIGTKKDYHKYDKPQDIQLKLTVPQVPNKKITFVEIDVHQALTKDVPISTMVESDKITSKLLLSLKLPLTLGILLQFMQNNFSIIFFI